ncbi:hypothetical protein DOY81_004256 [Sarcophaga bullata]|nr:hypothetical protein DOY81_004256 [Sarcophaga bullata]
MAYEATQLQRLGGKVKEIENQATATIEMNKTSNRLNTNAYSNRQSWNWNELSEKLSSWSNITTTTASPVEWLNLTDKYIDSNEVFTRTKASDPFLTADGTGTLFSTTLSFNHTDRNLFTFHDDCLANSNTLSHIFTIVLYSVVCVVGLFGNTLVIWVVMRFSKMQTVTNIYILNLAIADECFLIGIPFLLYTMRICSWKFGDYMCKAYMVSTSITQFTSSIFLLIMAADRYIAVCHPIESPKYRTLRIAKLVSLLAWFTSAMLMLPVILFASTVRQEDGINFSCNIDWPEVYKKHSGTTFILYTFVLGFATPLCFILGFYYLVIRKLHSVQQKHKSKEKKRSHRKVTRLVLTVITVYILCWLPHWISQVSLINAYVSQRELSRFEILLFLLFGCLAYSNSAMNPILYAFLSDNFRKSFFRAFTCMNQHDVEAQLVNEHSVFTHKRSGSGSKRKTSRHLSVPKAITAPNNSLFLTPTTVHNSGSASGSGSAAISGCSGGIGGSSSATSTSTATTATDKSANIINKKPNEQNYLNGDVVGNNRSSSSKTNRNKDDERIHMVVSHDQGSSYGYKTELCNVDIQNQTDV